jgi:hypothetical protein
VLPSCWQKEERALLCGKIRSTTCQITKFLAQHSTQCVFQRVQNFISIVKRFYTDNLFSFTDHRKVIGFSLDSNESAIELWQWVERLISNPENIALSSPGRKKRTKKRTKPMVLPPKSQISHPCQFLHVTKVTTYDTPRYFSLQAFVSSSHRHKDY